MSRRIIIDLSDLYSFLTAHTRVSGIQRVLVNFATRLLARQDKEVVAGYFDQAHGFYGRFPNQSDLRDLEALKNSTRFSHVRRFRLEKYRDKPIRRFYHLARTRILHFSEASLFPRIFPWRLHPAPEPLPFREGDVILSLGAGWDATDMFRIVEPAAKDGTVSLIVLVHDMTPIAGVDGRGGLPPEIFEGWLDRAGRCTRRFLTYSENTKKDLVQYWTDRGLGDLSVEVFPLPHEFLSSGQDGIGSQVQRLETEQYVLFVGPLTFQRKNADRLIAAWSRLLEELGPQRMPRLVLAGRGSRADLRAADADRLGDHLELVHMPSDSELEFLYRNAMFTVFPSIYEGWGLPIGESLWFGKLCVASNTSSMPEVGGDLCDYFDPYDVNAMVEALRHPIVDPAYRKSREAAIAQSLLTTWEDSTNMLCEAALRLADRVKAA